MEKKKQHMLKVTCRCGLMFLFLVQLTGLYGQQIPVYSGYFFNKYLVNPAFTGIDNEYRAFGFYRTQWSSLPGRPVTGGASAEASVWKDRIGIGGFVINDRIGIFDRINASVSYAQKIQFAKDHQVAIGLQGGIFTNRIDFASATTADLADPGLLQQKPIKTVFDMSVGISYKWKQLLLGFSVPNVIQPLAKYASAGYAANYEYVRHYSAFAQYKFKLLHGKFNITPVLFMRKGPATKFQFDATVVLDYNNLVFAGGGYRNQFGAIGMVGVNVLNMFTLAYACDFTTQPAIAGQVGSTHEIIAGFHLPSSYKPKKHTNGLDIMEPAGLSKLQKHSDSLAAALRSTRKALDTATTGNKNLKNQNGILQQENNNYKKLTDSLAQKVDLLLQLKNLSSEKNLQGNSYRLDKIFFEYKKYDLLPESMEQLNSLAAFMERFPKVQILISGYTDDIGGGLFNGKLSLNRAEAVAKYLLQHGVAANRIEVRGMGSSNPVADNATDEGRKLNRRVEFTITKE